MDLTKISLVSVFDANLEQLNRGLAMKRIILDSVTSGIDPASYCRQKFGVMEPHYAAGYTGIGNYNYAKEFHGTVTVTDDQWLSCIISLWENHKIPDGDAWLVYVYRNNLIYLYEGRWKKLTKDYSLCLNIITVFSTGEKEESQTPADVDIITMLSDIMNRISSIETKLIMLDERTEPVHVTIKGGKIIKKEVKKIQENMYEDLQDILDEYFPDDKEYMEATKQVVDECVDPLYDSVVDMIAALEHRINEVEVNLMDSICKIDEPVQKQSSRPVKKKTVKKQQEET